MSTSAPWILGLASSHNGSACLLHGDRIVAAIQEERLVRTKRADYRPALASLAIQYCLDAGGIGPADLSCIVTSTWRDNTHVDEDVHLNEMLRPHFRGVETHRIGHHLAHAVGAFATSGFREAAVLVVDGNGSPVPNLSEIERLAISPAQMRRYQHATQTSVFETVSLYEASGTSVRPIEKHVGMPPVNRPGRGMPYFWSLGRIYGSVGHQIFGSSLDGPGKVMGLAPFGIADRPWSDFFDIVDGEFVFRNDVPDLYDHEERWPNRRREYENLCASTQAALEHGLMTLVARLRAQSPQRNLCYAGGVALNCIANERIVRESGFDDCYFMPAAEDSGTSIGAAYYGLWEITGVNTGAHLRHDAVGRSYTSDEIRAAIDSAPIVLTTRRSDLGETARALAAGEIVGWFQGRSELGPRALGQRSILCDPRRDDMKDVLNARVKLREGFRPFAPVVPEEDVMDWFEVPAQHTRSPHMLRVVPVRSDKRHLIPAVTHVDGTGRLQTLSAADNGPLYELVRRFADLTGVPVLLNTSFNRAGQPIVETPDDALLCFLATGIDRCVLGDHTVQKEAAAAPLLDLFVELTAEWVTVDKPVEHGRMSFNGTRPEGHLTSGIWSTHLDAARLLNRIAATHLVPHLRLVSRTRWGRVMTVAPQHIMQIVECLGDGITGRQLMERLAAIGVVYSEQEVASLLLRLREIAIVALRRAPASRDAASSVESIHATAPFPMRSLQQVP